MRYTVHGHHIRPDGSKVILTSKTEIDALIDALHACASLLECDDPGINAKDRARALPLAKRSRGTSYRDNARTLRGIT